MLLFERVRYLYQKISQSQAEFARALDLTPATFNGYLKESRQDNLWPLLPKILELFPQISRNWLYFGEGEMIGEQITAISEKKSPGMQELQAKNTELEEELREANRLNRRLMERLLDEATNKVK